MKLSATRQPTAIAFILGATAGLVLVCCPPAIADAFDVNLYIAKGYAPIGPVQVDSISSNTLVLYTQPKKTSVNLKGRTVSVMDQSNKPLTLASVTKGTWAYVLQKTKEVIIVVLPAKEVRDDQ